MARMLRKIPSRRPALVLATLFLLGAPASSWAAHPYITDDTGTQGTGNWQLELMAEHDRNARTADPGGGAVHQVRKVTLFNPVLTYGVLDNLDVAFGLNQLRQRTTEDGAVTQEANGTGDSTLELKWRFYDADGLSLALKPGLVLPTGDENRGLGTGRLSWGVNLILTREAKPWVFLANAAYSRARYKLPADEQANRGHLWRASAGLAYYLRDDFRLVGEAGVRTNGARDDPFLPGQNGRFAMLGVIYSPSDKMDFDVGIRKGLNRAEFDTAILVGVTVRW
ncbi:MAG: transporter [Betaproteobacteria bacterium]|nr:transporter [Betaproteobacteria bacterium]